MITTLALLSCLTTTTVVLLLHLLQSIVPLPFRFAILFYWKPPIGFALLCITVIITSAIMVILITIIATVMREKSLSIPKLKEVVKELLADDLDHKIQSINT